MWIQPICLSHKSTRSHKGRVKSCEFQSSKPLYKSHNILAAAVIYFKMYFEIFLTTIPCVTLCVSRDKSADTTLGPCCVPMTYVCRTHKWIATTHHTYIYEWCPPLWNQVSMHAQRSRCPLILKIFLWYATALWNHSKGLQCALCWFKHTMKCSVAESKESLATKLA